MIGNGYCKFKPDVLWCTMWLVRLYNAVYYSLMKSGHQLKDMGTVLHRHAGTANLEIN